MREHFRCGQRDSREMAPRWLLAVLVGLLSVLSNTVWAADTGKLIEKDGKYVFVESIDPATKLLLQRAVKQGTITQEEYETVLKESQERQYLLQPSFKAWYDRGFNFSMNDNDFFLKMRFRAQMRFTQRYRNDAWRNPGDAKNFPELLGVFGDYRANRSDQSSSTFNLRRVRMYFMGHLFNPDFKYYIQMRAETAENAQSPGGLGLMDLAFTSTHYPLANDQSDSTRSFSTGPKLTLRPRCNLPSGHWCRMPSRPAGSIVETSGLRS